MLLLLLWRRGVRCIYHRHHRRGRYYIGSYPQVTVGTVVVVIAAEHFAEYEHPEQILACIILGGIVVAVAVAVL